MHRLQRFKFNKSMIDFKEIVRLKSDEELLKMVYSFDKWNPQMLQAVEVELSNRNILPNDINDKRKQLIDIEEANLTKGKSAGMFGKLVGFVTIFGLLGIMIGYHYAFAKVKSTYTDKVYFHYDESTRKVGKFLFYAGILASSLFILLKILETAA